MDVAVVEAGQHAPALEVDDLRLWPGQLEDFIAGSNSQNAVAPNCQRVGFKLLGVNRPNLAVDQNQVGDGMACGSFPVVRGGERAGQQAAKSNAGNARHELHSELEEDSSASLTDAQTQSKHWWWCGGEWRAMHGAAEQAQVKRVIPFKERLAS